MLIIPVYQIGTGKRVDNIPQWLIDVEGRASSRDGINTDERYKLEHFQISDNTFHCIVYNRSTYNPFSTDNNMASLIGRYDYTYKDEDIGIEYIILY